MTTALTVWVNPVDSWTPQFFTNQHLTSSAKAEIVSRDAVMRLAPPVVLLAFLFVQACSATERQPLMRRIVAITRSKNSVAHTCVPNYSGYVRIASDVDCAGGEVMARVRKRSLESHSQRHLWIN